SLHDALPIFKVIVSFKAICCIIVSISWYPSFLGYSTSKAKFIFPYASITTSSISYISPFTKLTDILYHKIENMMLEIYIHLLFYYYFFSWHQTRRIDYIVRFYYLFHSSVISLCYIP